MSSTPAPSPPELSALQVSQLDEYLRKLLDANKKFNLTAIVDPSQAKERHIDESLRLLPIVASVLPQLGPSNATAEASSSKRPRALDVGTGGGLPGMVLAIARPDVDFVLLEATSKKARFLDDTTAELGLSNVRVKCQRAELAGAPGSAFRESFDLVTARAVAALPTLLELTVPFLKVGGSLVAIKGQRYQEELDAAQRACGILHIECKDIIKQSSATVLLLEKLQRTSPTYPRRSGEPKKKPL